MSDHQAQARLYGEPWPPFTQDPFQGPRQPELRPRKPELPHGRACGISGRHPGHGGAAGWSGWSWTAPGILEALIPGRMQGHGGTAEVSR